MTRYFQYLDGGAPIYVDNASGWPNEEVWNLVLAADRSTREDCVYTPPDIKGLFKLNDRIVVTQNYIAWFDFSIGDGVQFPNPPYVNNARRSGELAGFWTLNPQTRLFKYYRMGPNGCWNWPANELITGSASPNGGTNWWDHYSPAVEHSLGIYTNDGSKNMYMMFTHTQNTGTFRRVLDGYEDAAGIHYKNSGKMAAPIDGGYVTDIYDGNDAVKSAQWIDAEVEYICRPNDIVTIFKFKPTVTVDKSNMNVGMWVAYGQDIDDMYTEDGGYGCDAGGPGSQWPSEHEVTKRPAWTISSNPAYRNWTGQTPIPAHTFVQLELGRGCPGSYFNYDVWSPGPTDNSYMRWGVHPTLAASEPRWEFRLLGNPGQGAGTYADPENLEVGHLQMGNERRDGTMYGGAMAIFRATLTGNRWYQVKAQIGTSNF